MMEMRDRTESIPPTSIDPNLKCSGEVSSIVLENQTENYFLSPFYLSSQME